MIGSSPRSNVIDARQQFHDRSEEYCWQILRGTLHQSDVGGQVVQLIRPGAQPQASNKGAA